MMGIRKTLSRGKFDLRIARQGVKLKFEDFQLTTQEHSHPILEKTDLIDIAYQAWHERRNGRGVRLVGFSCHVARSTNGTTTSFSIISIKNHSEHQGALWLMYLNILFN